MFQRRPGNPGQSFEEQYETNEDYSENMNFEQQDEFYNNSNNNWQEGNPKGGWRANRGEWGGYRGGRGGGRGGWGPPHNYGNFPRDPGFAWGRGFGPNGPPIQRPREAIPAVRYLKRCGVSRQNLRDLPREFFALIEPEQCSVCDITFTGFPASRAHYTSKAHFRKQNNWLNLHYDGGSRPRELPLKPRSAYCELCDVHITSEVHAKSHYSGKSHRSIVEGRKPPKNQNLLHKTMEYRLNLLLRREKKHIKDEPATEVEESVENPKPVSSELFCEICKTSVTCTDQMTMHRNGKKHLSREKQHILKMMKGTAVEENKDKDKPEEEVNKEDKEGDDAAEVEEVEGDDDKYDWGTGSGIWDDPQ